MASEVGFALGGYHVGELSEVLHGKRRIKKSKKDGNNPNNLSSLFCTSQSFQPAFVAVKSDTKITSKNLEIRKPKLSKLDTELDGKKSDKEIIPSTEPKQLTVKKRKAHESDDDKPAGLPKKKKYLPKKLDSPERLARTVFVGNLPVSMTKKKLKKLFVKYGEVESARFRSATMENPNLSRKVAMKKREFHPDKPFVNGYIVFKEASSAQQATESNGEEVDGLHIRVDVASCDRQHDHRRSIFVGNLPFDLNDEQMREAFIHCGQIESVRLVRDQKTRIGKGFGFVLFRDKDAISFALKMNGKPLKGRTLRVFPSSEKPTDNVKKLRKGKPSTYSFSGMEAKRTRNLSDKKRKQHKNAKSGHNFSGKKFSNEQKTGRTGQLKGYQNKNAALKRLQNKGKKSKR